MEKVTVIMKSGRVRSMDARFARTLVKLKKAVYADSYEKKVIEPNFYETKTLNNDKVIKGMDELSNAREEYKEKFGKRPFHGWGLDVLKSKIDEAE